MKLLVGLGNPGKDYQNTRHNLGFLAIDHLSASLGIKLKKKKRNSLWGSGLSHGDQVFLLKPQTYMNLSGEAVAYFSNYYRIPLEDIVVVCDDVNLDFGTIRIRRSGSAGGHNGLKSIIECLESSDFTRLRLGVGEKKGQDDDLVHHVLGPFSQNEQEDLPEFLDRVGQALIEIIKGNTDQAMNLYNGRNSRKN